VLEVRLLGTLEAQARGIVLPAPAHPQGPALLAWLALNPGEQERGAVAALLWPGLPRANARTALRSAVWALRRMLGPDEGLVLNGRETIGLRCSTDLQEFERLAAAGESAAALELCRGELLADLGREYGWVLAARAEHAAHVEVLRAQLRADAEPRSGPEDPPASA
jgi:DNA-binding SARP family transcriptional activator